MSSSANTYWAALSRNRAGSPAPSSFNPSPLGNPALSRIQSAAAIKTRLSLTGIQVGGLNLPSSDLSLALSTKKYKSGVVPYLSVAAVTSGSVTAAVLRQVTIRGGNFDSPSVQATGGGQGDSSGKV